MTWSFVPDTVLQYLFVASRERAGLNHLRLSYIFQKEGGNIFQSTLPFDRIGRKLEKQNLAKGFKFIFFIPNLNVFCSFFFFRICISGFYSCIFLGYHILASILAHFYGFLHFGFYCFGFHILASILHIFVGAPKPLLNIPCRFCSPHSQPMN